MPVTSAVDEITGGKSAVDDENWFRDAAKAMHPHKPGTILHIVTTLGDERLCQRYAAGHVKPPAYFLRALLRSDHGEQWLNAVMDGSGAAWWIEHCATRSGAEHNKAKLAKLLAVLSE